MSARPAELRALTGARGIAAWLVVFYHLRLSIAGLPPSIGAMLAKGYLAVDFFFLLSGFVIWLAWHERLREGRGAARRFWAKRIARVWPLHLTMLTFAAALALLLALTGRDMAARFPIAELPLHLLLVQDWGLTDRLTWNDPAWSISAELAAYLLFPFAAARLDWRKVPTPAIIAALAVLFILLHMLFALRGATSLGSDITTLGTPRCLLEFSAGSALCALWLRSRDQPRLPTVASAGCFIAAIIALAAGCPETLAMPPALAALLLTLAFTDRGNPLGGRVTHWLGEISFATYLSHFLLFFAFKLAMVDNARAIPAMLVALYLAMVLAASHALHHLVERPAQRWVEAFNSRRSLARAERPSPRPA